MTGSVELIIYDLNQLQDYPPVSSVLDLAVSITSSDAAHLYWMAPGTDELRLMSVSPTAENSRVPRVSLQFSGSRDEPGIFSAEDPSFHSYPETVASEVSTLMVSPLRVEQKLVGILTLSRKARRRYGRPEIETAAKLGKALVAAMGDQELEREVTALRARLRSVNQENMALEKRLAERKLMERAKGLLQVHYGWTEEDAYYHLRRTSRQQRTPMAVIAQRVIDVVTAKEMEKERMLA
jgi:AmiR/NasT family two-component response regulator